MKRTISEVKENIYKIHGNTVTLLNESLPKYKENLSLYCNVCGNKFEATYDNFVNKGSNCPYCAGHIKTNDEFVNELISLYGDKLMYDKVNYVSARTRVVLICPKHGEFKRTPNKLLCGQGCSKCKSSLLENLVMRTLDMNNIRFEVQKRFDWLGKQSLDFYLPSHKIAIECQGEQHFHQVYFNGKTENVDKRNLFESIVKRDNVKYNKCKDNGITILYFIDNKISTEEVEGIPMYDSNYFYNVNELIPFLKMNKEIKKCGYWNDIQHCIEESKKYTTINELKKNSNGCYASVLKHHWENVCFPNFIKRKPNGYWNVKEHCIEEAKKYRNLNEFQKLAYGAYNCAKKNGWKDEISKLYDKTILYNSYDENIHSVYIYIFEDEKVFYVGRTNNIKRRHQQHTTVKNDTLNKYCKQKQINVPNYIILKEKLNAQESQFYEDFYLNEYKNNGWKPLNIAVTGINKGSLGATCKWTYESCREEAKKYNTITEFEFGNQSAYNACKRNGWTYDFFTTIKKYDNYWDNYENCKKAFEECSSARELISKYGGCYNAIKRNGFNDLKYERKHKYKQNRDN